MTASIGRPATASNENVESTSPATHRPLAFEDRVAAQRAIEEVYWAHRIWPRENPGPKPSFESRISEAQLRSKVQDYLSKSVALEVLWRRPITQKDLQSELDRMASTSRDPGMLKELFEALGPDAHVIGETLVRQSLVDRRMRQAYARDDRFHGALHLKADEVRDSMERTPLAAVRVPGAEYREFRWQLHDRDHVKRNPNAVQLDRSEWDRLLKELSARLPAGLPGSRSDVEETEDRFQLIELLESTPLEVVLGALIWPKQGMDAWWQAQDQDQWDRFVEPAGVYSMPALEAGCAPDTWGQSLGGFPGENPESRAENSVVWTGTEMIVWGGRYADITNTGGRYNPATDTWTRTSIGVDVPEARFQHTAVWTGDRMIVWGGYGPNGYSLNSGGSYDPLGDRWSPINSGEAPSPRQGYTAIWTGTEMIVWGGMDQEGRTNTGARYRPDSDSWQPTSLDGSVPSGRLQHTAVWTGVEMIVWGGKVADNTPTNTGGRYDPLLDIWVPISADITAPSARTGHTAVWTGSEMIIWGGSDRFGTRNSGARYNPTTDSWVATGGGASVPSSRHGHRAVWTGSEMLVWGGNAGGTPATGERYDPASDSWLPIPTDPSTPRSSYYPSVVWTGSEMIVWGAGENAGGRYDPVTDSWTPTAVDEGMPAYGTGVWTGTEMIVWGAVAGDPLPLARGARYDPATNAFTLTSTGPNAPPAFGAGPAVWTGAEMVLWGGGSYPTYTNTGSRYDPVVDVWSLTSITDAPSPRGGHTAVWTGTEMIVWGGYGASGNLATGGRYDGGADRWLPMSSLDAPPRRSAHTAVWTGTKMIVWGGYGDDLGEDWGETDTGGIYDPQFDRWTATSLVGAPSRRVGHTAVWTGSEMIVWGGSWYMLSWYCGGARYNPVTDTWANVPCFGSQVREHHRAVWTGSDMIVWGGVYAYNGSDPLPLNSGVRYRPATNSAQPTPIDTNTPSARSPALAFWTGSAMLVWGGSYPASGAPYCAPVPEPEDETPPGALTFAFSPTAVDTRNAAATVQCILGATDAPSGIQTAYCVFESPSGRRISAPLSLVGGSPNLGTWEGSVSLPRASENGTWRAHLWLLDNAYNAHEYGPTELAGAGMPSELVVIGPTDGARWVDCVHGDDNNDGLSASAPMKTITAAMQTVPASMLLELHLLPGTCPYEPWLELPARAHVIGSGPDATFVESSFLLGANHICDCSSAHDCAYRITGVTVDSATTYYSCIRGSIELDNARIVTEMQMEGRLAALIRNSRLGSLDGAAYAAEVATLDIQNSEIANSVYLYSSGTELIVTIRDSQFSAADLSGNVKLDVTRSIARGVNLSGPSGTTLTVTDSLFENGYVWLPCTAHPCDYRFERNTFRSTWIVVQASQPFTALIRGNVFTGIDGAAITVYGDVPPPEVSRNNFDEVTDPLCVQCSGGICQPTASICSLPPNNLAVPSGFVGPDDYHLSTTSPLIDAGDPSDLLATLDLDGFPRPVDGNGDGVVVHDIGAFEFTDPDGDQRDVRYDNCPMIANQDQADTDADGPGDACDNCGLVANSDQTDADQDMVGNVCDNCLITPNANQLDSDADAIGDVCDNCASVANPGQLDGDADTVGDVCDNCPSRSNPLQTDQDGDLRGDACDNCARAFNPDQLDVDHDTVGNACDNCLSVPNASQLDTDSDQRGNACDNCPLSYNPFQDDIDQDGAGDACDNCLFDSNPSQSDFNADSQGDLCDLDDGLIYLFNTGDPGYIEWQGEHEFGSWNVYEGDLGILRSGGPYTQLPGSNPRAERHCGVTDLYVDDFSDPAPETAVFHLVTGIAGGVESSLGTNSAGVTRVNSNPCP
jgi:N-acetylneuraminic acid mutarotase